jgi:hypothetical protein
MISRHFIIKIYLRVYTALYFPKFKSLKFRNLFAFNVSILEHGNIIPCNFLA